MNQKLEYRTLLPIHKAEMMKMQDTVMAALPDPRWYFPSEEWEFDDWLRDGDAIGAFDGDTLAGYAVITPASARKGHAYAEILGESTEGAYDFHDVMVLPAYRGRGIHTEFLSMFAETVRALGGRAIYCTVDPENGPSRHNFEKAGYEFIVQQSAYDGRVRRYYRLTI